MTKKRKTNFTTTKKKNNNKNYCTVQAMLQTAQNAEKVKNELFKESINNVIYHFILTACIVLCKYGNT